MWKKQVSNQLNYLYTSYLDERKNPIIIKNLKQTPEKEPVIGIISSKGD